MIGTRHRPPTRSHAARPQKPLSIRIPPMPKARPLPARLPLSLLAAAQALIPPRAGAIFRMEV
jgi:hypothetical protein